VIRVIVKREDEGRKIDNVDYPDDMRRKKTGVEQMPSSKSGFNAIFRARQKVEFAVEVVMLKHVILSKGKIYLAKFLITEIGWSFHDHVERWIADKTFSV